VQHPVGHVDALHLHTWPNMMSKPHAAPAPQGRLPGAQPPQMPPARQRSPPMGVQFAHAPPAVPQVVALGGW
jgi:hypothetical protein